MANELWHNFPSGSSLDAYVRKKTDDEVFDENSGTNTFEVWQDGNVANYDIPMADNGGDYYSVNFPAIITTSGVFRVAFKLRAGGTAAVGDLVLAQGEIEWDGTTEITGFILSGETNKVHIVLDENA